MRGRRASIGTRLALAVGAALAALVLLELGLRLAAALRPDHRGGGRGKTTILCVGDSHTYGLHVLPHQSYPAQLQALLDPTASEVGVLNYGVPGRNSSALLRELPGDLDQVRPDVLLALVGFNDTWNFDAAREGDRLEEPGFFAQLRTVRLARLLLLRLRGRAGPPEIVERDGRTFVFDDGELRPAAVGGSAFGVLDGPALTERVTANLERIAARAREHGAAPVFLTYATENQPVFLLLNECARAAGSRLGVPVVDLAAALRPAIAELRYADLFFPDDHPTAAGNERVAARVAEVLIAAGLATRSARPAPAGSAPPPVLAVAAVGSALEFTLTGPPELDFQVVLSPREGPPIEFAGATIPIGADPLMARSLESPNLRGRLDRGGAAALHLDRSFLGDAAQGRVYAIGAVFPRGLAADALPLLSNRVAIDPR